MAAVGTEQKSVAVGRCIRRKAGTNDTGAPRPVLHDERLPKSGLQLVCKNTRVDVRRSPCGERHNDTHGSAWITFCSACLSEYRGCYRKAEGRQNDLNHAFLRAP